MDEWLAGNDTTTKKTNLFLGRQGLTSLTTSFSARPLTPLHSTERAPPRIRSRVRCAWLTVCMTLGTLDARTGAERRVDDGGGGGSVVITRRRSGERLDDERGRKGRVSRYHL